METLTDLDGAVEEAIVLSGSVEKTFGVWSEDLMRRAFGHADLLFVGWLIFTRHGRHHHRCGRHISPLKSKIFFLCVTVIQSVRSGKRERKKGNSSITVNGHFGCAWRQRLHDGPGFLWVNDTFFFCFFFYFNIFLSPFLAVRTSTYKRAFTIGRSTRERKKREKKKEKEMNFHTKSDRLANWGQ